MITLPVCNGDKQVEIAQENLFNLCGRFYSKPTRKKECDGFGCMHQSSPLQILGSKICRDAQHIAIL